MYVCSGCRSYFKTGGSGKKIRCPKCKTEFLTSLKITDEKWKLLDRDARNARINRAIAGEQLRDEVPAPEVQKIVVKRPQPAAPATASAPAAQAPAAPAPGPATATPAPAAQAPTAPAPAATSPVPSAPAPAPVSPEEPKPAKTMGADTSTLFKADAPDEAILEARRLLEQKDVQAEMPAPRMDKKRFMVVCVTALVILFSLYVFTVIVPMFSTKKEMAAIMHCKTGDVIDFGCKEMGRWKIIDAEEDRILVVSDAPAPVSPLKSDDDALEWLNSVFMNRYFNMFERKRIIAPGEGEYRIFLMPENQAGDGVYPSFWILL